MADENRQFKRYPQKIELLFGSQDEFVSAFTIDLGAGGLFIKTHKSLTVGEFLYVEFNLPESHYHIEAEAEVCWVRNNGDSQDGLGLRFHKMSRGNYLKIVSYLDSIGYIPCQLSGIS